ncbi:ABC transporter ATP-binding protein [Streptomonospora litoralis]|uniref:Daunorubicin/doxorubicin resistance ATP-binding protein DrrA n=1 Tax=Streptomonospora litoralis TaxID=2498135 RepID=A0A4P6QB76_9ACTN|nr:ABC transporter ATP-binding protein [Streptomonospora litoralis]QBI56637.1 Daunorubicin/doxorubicin resistance ATP-binding protein DrrA [Streptomonospora litoralis]
MTPPIARLHDVSRRYGTAQALDRVSLDVEPGAVLGLLGRNGAGKSTLINLVCGLRRPTEGKVELFGGSPQDPRRRRELGMTPQQTGLPESLRVREVVDFVSRHYPDPMPPGDLLERFGLMGLEKRQTGSLSGGQQRRLAVGLAFLGRPRLVLLDEPTTGLDVSARRAVWEGIRAYIGSGGTILLTSHYLEEMEALSERITVLKRGRVVADGTPQEVVEAASRQSISFHAEQAPHLTGIVDRERRGDRQILYTDDTDSLVRALVASGTPFSGLDIHRPSLEEAFLEIEAESTADAAPDAAPAPEPANGTAEVSK